MIVVETLAARQPGEGPRIEGGVVEVLGPPPVTQAVDERSQHEDIQDRVHQSGGEIYVTSALEEGTAVEIYLPEMKEKKKTQAGPEAIVSRMAGS